MTLNGKVTWATEQGPRVAQEDFFLHMHTPHGHLLGVLDGHNGDIVADVCRDVIYRGFDPSNNDAKAELHKIISVLALLTDNAFAGTTISLAYIFEQEQTVYTAILGDSPILAYARTSRIFVGIEHNVRSNVAERDAAIARGGVYEDGYIWNPATGKGLQMSRSLGDRELGGILSREPSSERFSIDENSVVIVASDGLLDCGHEDSSQALIRKLLKRARKGQDATKLLAWRKKQGGLKDNTTLLVWSHKQQKA